MVVLLMLVSAIPLVAAAEVELKPLTITAFSGEITGVAPGDVLTDIWREQTQTTVEYISRPQNLTGDEWIHMQMVADTLPDMIITHELSPETLDALYNTESVYEFSKEMVQEYLPRYTARLEERGLDLDLFLNQNRAPNGKLYTIPYELRDVSYPALQTDIRAIRSGVDSPYSFYFRDDILKAIFPEARSEQELVDLYIANGGKLTMEEAFGDIPVHNMSDLYDYLKQVKDLGFKVGEKDVIPGQLTVSSGVGSTLWSLQTAMGVFWQDGFSLKDDKLIHVQSHDIYKEYIRWYSIFNAEGLIDREAWIMKDDQIRAKAINGEFAVFNYWLPINEARQLAKDEGRGYGYRLVPAFDIPLENEWQNMTIKAIGLTSAVKVMITKSVNEADVPQVLNWVDWNLSREAEDLRAWGIPDFYEGEGENRRFKPEYAEVEAWALFGIFGEKDGAYYGLPGQQFSNPEVHKISMAGNYDTPRYVYPKTLSSDMNLDNELFAVIREYYGLQVTFYAQTGWTIQQNLANDEIWKEALNEVASPELDGLLAQAMVADPADFDAVYQEYYDTAYPQVFQDALEHLKGVWADLYAEKVVPEVERARAYAGK